MSVSKIWHTWHATSAQRKRRVGLCWIWFFLVLFCYYLIKPLRDAWGTPLADRLGDLYLATFICTLVVLPIYSQLVAWLSRLQVVHVVYHISAACLLAFAFAFDKGVENPRWLAALFFVWVSVFNLLVVTVFWSVMADLFTSDEGKLWFGSMAAAGSLGSLAGSITARALSENSPAYILLWAAAVICELIVFTAWCILHVPRPIAGQVVTAAGNSTANVDEPTPDAENVEHGTGGTLWAGVSSVLTSRYLLAICLFVALGKFAATFVYNNLQLTLDVEMPISKDRTVLFAQMNIWTQGASLFLQAVGASLLMNTLGVGATLTIPCVLLLGMFAWLSVQATLAALVVSQVAQQILGYGLLVPAQHVLFTVVSREEKYKTKAFVDMVVFRGSDVAAGQACQWMIKTGVAVTMLSLAMLPVVAGWTVIAIFLGLEYQRRQMRSEQLGNVPDGR